MGVLEDYPPYKIFISFIWVIAAVYLFRLFIGNHQIEVGSQAISLPDIYDSITPKNLSRTPGFVQVVVVPETVVDAEPNSIRPVQVSPAIKNLIQDQTIIYSHEGGQLFDRFFKALDQTTQEGLKTRILFFQAENPMTSRWC